MDPAEICQIAKIKVDHEGTEAAAVTEIVKGAIQSIDDTRPFEFICDKPFAYYITDTVNNDIAFIGVVNHI